MSHITGTSDEAVYINIASPPKNRERPMLKYAISFLKL